MKQLKEFELWAENIYEAALDNSDVEKKQISRERDIVHQAAQQYPDLTRDQALGLYLDDKLKQFDRRDLEQNAVINSQRKENAKLSANLTNLQQELSDIETLGKRADAEIDRLKSLSGRLTTDVQQRVVSRTDIERALAQVEELKNKPGMSDDRYNELKKDLEKAKQNVSNINPQEFEKLSSQIKTMSGEQTIEKEQLRQLKSLADKITTQQKEVETEKTGLASKVAQLEKNQRELEQREQKVSKEIEDKVSQSVAAATEKTKKYRKAVQARSKQSSTLIKNFLNKDLPELDRLVTQELPQEMDDIRSDINVISGQIQDIASKLSQQNINIPSTKKLPASSSRPTKKELPTPDDTDSAAELATNAINKYLRYGINSMKSLDAEKEQEELTEETQLSLFPSSNQRQKIDPYQVWKNAGITAPMAEKYVNAALSINKMINSSDEDENQRAYNILYLVEKVTDMFSSEIDTLKNDPKYDNFEDVFDGIVIYLVHRTSIGYDNDQLDQWRTSPSYPKIIYKQLLSELNRILSTLEYLKRKSYNQKSQSLPTRGTPSKDFQKLHNEPPAPEEPSTLPPVDLFLNESIESMIDNIVGEQITRWIK